MGAWVAVEFAIDLLGLTRQLGDDPANRVALPIMGVAVLAVLGYLLWEFGISEIIERTRRTDRDPPDEDE
jgi:hypothetical protein